MHAPLVTGTSTSYRPDIDGLRAVAVLAVVFFHAFPNEQWLPGGFIGVDVFFVISGYLISRLILAELDERRFSIADFYQRRARRIFPALATCLAATLCYGFLVLIPSELAALGKHVFFGASFFSNFAFWSETGYFDSAATSKPLQHLWSLGIEEQFYILWPAILIFAFRSKLRIGWLIAALLTASFAANITLSDTDLSSAFYLPMPRFWELLAGAALAHRGNLLLDRRVRQFLSIIGCAAIVISAIAFTPEMRFPGWLAALPVAGAAAVIAAGPDTWINRRILANRAAVFVGLISYPLYLWHWPLISFSYILRGKPPTLLLAAGLVALSFLLAWATYRYIERPVRFGANRRGRTLVIVACLFAIAAGGMVVWMKDGFPARFRGLDIGRVLAATFDSSFAPTEGMEVSTHNHTYVTRIGRGDRKVALAGDSVMFHYGARLQQLLDQGDLASSVWFVSGGSCAPVPGIIKTDFFAHCANLPTLLTELVRHENIQTVVLGGSWPNIGEGAEIERGGKRLSSGALEGFEAYYSNLEDYIRSLQALGARIYLVLSPPADSTRLSPHKMVTRRLTGFSISPTAGAPVPIAELKGPSENVAKRLQLVAERTGVPLLDPYPDICGDGETCAPFFADNEPKFSDGQHLRPKFVRHHIRFLDFLLR